MYRLVSLVRVTNFVFIKVSEHFEPMPFTGPSGIDNLQRF